MTFIMILAHFIHMYQILHLFITKKLFSSHYNVPTMYMMDNLVHPVSKYWHVGTRKKGSITRPCMYVEEVPYIHSCLWGILSNNIEIYNGTTALLSK